VCIPYRKEDKWKFQLQFFSSFSNDFLKWFFCMCVDVDGWMDDWIESVFAKQNFSIFSFPVEKEKDVGKINFSFSEKNVDLMCLTVKKRPCTRRQSYKNSRSASSYQAGWPDYAIFYLPGDYLLCAFKEAKKVAQISRFFFPRLRYVCNALLLTKMGLASIGTFFRKLILVTLVHVYIT
jgi:hypothetical protein